MKKIALIVKILLVISISVAMMVFSRLTYLAYEYGSRAETLFFMGVTLFTMVVLSKTVTLMLTKSE